MLPIAIVGFFLSCSDNDGSTECDGFSAKLNGENWISSSMSHSLAIDTNWLSGLVFRRGIIESINSANEHITIYYDNPLKDDDDCVTLGDYDEFPFDSTLFHLTAMKFMDIDSNVTFMNTTSFVVLSCDEDSRNITGTFSFQDDSGDIIATDGEFSVCY